MKRSFAHIRSHTFRGKRYKIEWKKPDTKSHGECEDPSEMDKTIRIAPSLSEFDLLETALHEADHACHFDLDETSVEQAAEDKARFLWRMGFRLK